ncbi:MAG TPA: Flp family type IVb pilin [Elusimicrobiota bacterium]|nr:Flp family type IVb pilin [Elusimicrobiota bacterium]
MDLTIGTLWIGGQDERNNHRQRIAGRRMGNPSDHAKEPERNDRKGEAMSRLKDKKGQGLVEYALILVLIGLVCLAIVVKLGGTVNSGFTKADTKIANEFDKV